MRGKYASNAASARAREDAIAAAEQLRHENTRLTSAMEQMAVERGKERIEHNKRMVTLNEKIKAGTTPELIALREELVEAHRHAAEADHDAGVRLNKIFGKYKDVLAPPGFWAEVAEALHIKVNELLADPAENRQSRRATPRRLRGMTELVGMREFARKVREQEENE